VLNLRRSPRSLKALTKEIKAMDLPVFQDADLIMAFLRSWPDADALGEAPCDQIRRAYRRHVETLEEYGALESVNLAPGLSAYQLPTAQLPPAQQIICILDPFAYLSHLSALAWHGLSERLPRTLFISRPSRSHWQSLANARREGRRGELAEIHRRCRLPSHRFTEFTRIGKHAVHTWTSSRLDREYQSAFKHISDQNIRVATIGRCFLDMVRAPELCGGIHHVMDTYAEHGPTYLELILAEIDTHGNKIEQARAGYLLEEASAGEHPVLDKWAADVTRGGSRKLDPSADYSEHYSEKWAISINV
jgi:predicted transcriptional regulator of viral defense system